MTLSNIKEVRELSIEQLQEQIEATKRELFDLRFQQATRQLEKPHLFRQTKRNLARLLTVEQEHQQQTQA
jgi:large subunit ribosomal protein L29